MFNNLIESSSHTKEFKRRGRFLLLTCATYLVLFAIAGVASIYAYDAHLEEQTTEIVTLLSPQELPTQRQPEVRPDRPRANDTHESNIPERAVAMLSVNHPEVVPDMVSAKPSVNLPLPEHGTALITGRDRNVGAGGPGVPVPGGAFVIPPRPIVEVGDPPPSAPEPPKPPKAVNRGVITSQAIYLPKPAYSEIAKRLRIQGTVTVQVLVDLDGKVISAKAVGGSPFLIPEAQKAAMQARFSPTLLSNQPVKVSGIITYNFVLGN